ncbi:MAG: AbrB/MazE/SpoVT family DNA-binding domain-containing protein [Burkholderiales bacterium]
MRNYNVITSDMNMKTAIIRIGNSKGVRLPKAVLDQAGLSGTVELEVAGDQVILRRESRTRAGWEEKFSKMAEHGDDKLFDQELSNAWDKSDWRW